MARSRRKSGKSRRGGALRRVVWRGLAVSVAGVLLYAGFLAWRVGYEFEGRRWDVPAQVFAAPLELYAGRALSADDLVGELKRLGYREDPRLPGAGSYRLGLGRMEIATRGFAYAGDTEPPRLVSMSFANGRIGALRDARGGDLRRSAARSAPDRQPVPGARRRPLDRRARRHSAAAYPPR